MLVKLSKAVIISLLLALALHLTLSFYRNHQPQKQPAPKPINLDSSNQLAGNNVALGKPIIQERGQVVYKDYAQRLTSENITDGDLSTGWRTETDIKNNNTIAVIDLLGAKVISAVAFKASWDTKPQFDDQIAFQIDYSNLSEVKMLDEEDWIRLGTVLVNSDDRKKLHSIEFQPVNAKYIRVQYAVEDDQWGGWGNLYEVLVY